MSLSSNSDYPGTVSESIVKRFKCSCNDPAFLIAPCDDVLCLNCVQSNTTQIADPNENNAAISDALKLRDELIGSLDRQASTEGTLPHPTATLERLYCRVCHAESILVNIDGIQHSSLSRHTISVEFGGHGHAIRFLDRNAVLDGLNPMMRLFDQLADSPSNRSSASSLNETSRDRFPSSTNSLSGKDEQNFIALRLPVMTCSCRFHHPVSTACLDCLAFLCFSCLSEYQGHHIFSFETLINELRRVKDFYRSHFKQLLKLAGYGSLAIDSIITKQQTNIAAIQFERVNYRDDETESLRDRAVEEENRKLQSIINDGENLAADVHQLEER